MRGVINPRRNGKTARALEQAARLREQDRIRARYLPSAREQFAIGRELLLASRPVLAIHDEGLPTQRVVYGAPTFRNVIEGGVLR